MRSADPRAAALAIAFALAGALAAIAPAARAQGVSPIPLDPFAGARSEPAPAPRPGAPRLVVALLYDQLRGDLLDAFDPAFGNDGFRRLQKDGARFTDCTLPYAITLTGPGHGTWLSGAPPSVHGIVANEWHEENPCGNVPCARDLAYPGVGVPDGGGSSGSPREMRAETVADVLTEATRGAGKVIAIADKARSAILPAGRRPTGVYWLDDDSGRMQSSSYYMKALPTWAERANEARIAKITAERAKPWTPLLPGDAYRGTIVEDPNNTFPHQVSVKGAKVTNPIAPEEHPVEGDVLFDFAEAAIQGEQLGADDVPDLLVVSVAVTDEIGHKFGADSPEALDVAARCDRRLGAFLKFLDEKVGRDRYVVTVTADHGISPTERVARQYLAAPFDSVGGVRVDSLLSWVGGALVRGAGPRGKGARAADVARGFSHVFVNRGIVFDDSLLDRIGLDRARAARIVAEAAHENPWLADGFTAEELSQGGTRNAFARLYARSFYAGRSADVVLMPRPYVLVGRTEGTGTTHGTPYSYDRLVPFLLYGRGVRTGTYGEPVSAVDIAPTIATMLGIPFPAQCEGKALGEALEHATTKAAR